MKHLNLTFFFVLSSFFYLSSCTGKSQESLDKIEEAFNDFAANVHSWTEYECGSFCDKLTDLMLEFIESSPNDEQIKKLGQLLNENGDWHSEFGNSDVKRVWLKAREEANRRNIGKMRTISKWMEEHEDILFH